MVGLLDSIVIFIKIRVIFTQLFSQCINTKDCNRTIVLIFARVIYKHIARILENDRVTRF